MKKIGVLILLLTGFANAQILNIPDANFKAKLLEASPDNFIAESVDGTFIKIDSNGDGEIQESEVLNVSVLFVYSSNITDLTGIEEFKNLTKLSCFNNQLTTLNVTQNKLLIDLNCRGNQLATLDVSQNESLTNLRCYNNQLTSLDVSQNTSLLHLNCGFNNLNSLDLSQNQSLEFLYCTKSELTSLDVSENKSLIAIECDFNELTSLDVSQNEELVVLICQYNQLSSLVLPDNTALQTLRCYNNALTSLVIPDNASLSVLDCNNNALTSLVIQNSTSLRYLYCHNNQLTSLDVSHMEFLQRLSCSDNTLTSLDIIGASSLRYLFCHENQLTSLDISQNKNLDFLYCNNNNSLAELNLKNGITKNDLWLYDNPNLVNICADEEEIDFIKEEVNEQLDHEVLISSYCSFTPGGDYNTISGSVNYDEELDGCDVDDLPKFNMRISINDGTYTGSSFTNESGDFSFFSNVGDYTITPELENPSYFTISPESISVNFTDEGNGLDNQNFCISPDGIKNDLEIVITPIETARPGFDAVYKIVYKNKGNQRLSGSVDFVYDDTVLDYLSASINPDTQSIGNLSWNYTSLAPFESRSFEVTLNVNSPMEVPAVNNDDVLSFTATINPVSGDETEADNMFDFNQTVVGSFDPNDIICIEGSEVAPHMIGEYLHYIINFENMGTYPASFIVVEDVIDTSKFDVGSLQVMSSSHNMNTKIDENNVEFIFDNINLEANAKGNIVFKIKSLSTLEIGDSVVNKANIYFDYNFPIETNLATTTFQNLLSNQENNFYNSITVSPNPTKGLFNVESLSPINSISIYDVHGRTVLTKKIKAKKASVELSNFKFGVYFIKVSTELGEKVQKLIKT